MIPPIWKTSDLRASQDEVAKNYGNAIREHGVKHVVNLSSIGAHVGSGVGPVDGVAFLERLLNDIPGLNVRHLRPSFFYYNFMSQITRDPYQSDLFSHILMIDSIEGKAQYLQSPFVTAGDRVYMVGYQDGSFRLRVNQGIEYKV